MNFISRWRLKRRSKWIAETCGLTVDELFYIVGLVEEIAKRERGELAPDEVEKLDEIIQRPSTRAIYAKIEAAGILPHRLGQLLTQPISIRRSVRCPRGA